MAQQAVHCVIRLPTDVLNVISCSPAALQSVDVRRGRLVALIESFVQMLGSAIEGVLNKVRILGLRLAGSG